MTESPVEQPRPGQGRVPSYRQFATYIGVLLIIGIGGIVYDHYKYDWFFPKRFGVVEQGKIYRSGQISSRFIRDILANNNIKVVIDLTGGNGQADQQAEAAAASQLGVETYRYPLHGDGTGDIHMYSSALKTLNDAVKAGKPTLIHCAAGTQRTGAAIAFYKLLVEKKPQAEAYADLIHYDWNPSRDHILIEYANSHMKELADLLVANGVIAAPPDSLPVLGP